MNPMRVAFNITSFNNDLMTKTLGHKNEEFVSRNSFTPASKRVNQRRKSTPNLAAKNLMVEGKNPLTDK